MKRKVVIIGPAHPLRGGGISTFNERLAKAYFDHGDDVVIYTFSLQYPSFLFPGTSQYTNEPPPENVKIKIKINSINPFNWIKVGKEIVREKPDIVIVRFWIPFMAPCLGKISRSIRKSGIRVIAIVDNIIPHEKKIMDHALANYFVKSVDCFVTMSNAVLEDLNKFDNKKPKLLTVHPLYDNFGESVSKQQAIAKLELSPDYQYILFFGFIREYKGLDLLLKAYSISGLMKFKIKLLIAGEFYTDKKVYLDLINKLRINDDVILKTSFIPNAEVVNYFCASNLVVQPYKEATQSGITQVAYHFNKPMITTNVGGLSEIVINNKVGFVVEPDAKEIAEAMVKYFEQNKEAGFSQNIESEKKRFSWETMINAIDKVASEV
ncbi:MAG: glycosyltransferase family 4 protein [Bacteroidales bacterium]|nr:glycosyltransferase family 4 protein [Bacteroidales bacterium]MCF8402398.1 glycosyltransferase family 4 protein [Bacteroidales bacterium]